MRTRSRAVRGTRHLFWATVQSLLLAASCLLLALILSAVYRPAGTVTGLGVADAGGTTRGPIVIPDGVFGGTTTAVAHAGDDAWVHISCFQAGARILEAYRQVDAAGRATFRLGPTPSWSSGAATCVGEDGYWARGTSWRVLASTTFDVTP